MESRIDYSKASPGAVKAMYGLETYIRMNCMNACAGSSPKKNWSI